MLVDWKLRASLAGHEQDVRCLVSGQLLPHLPLGSFISGSRDVTARVWTPDESGTYHESLCMAGHSGFISAIAVMAPFELYPSGCILTGSKDNNIFVWTLESPEPQRRITHHQANVCCLATSRDDPGFFVSGSWDKIAVVWSNFEVIHRLEGHEAAVWGVLIMDRNVITASADRTIKVWLDGKCEKTLRGHEDCVRAVALTVGGELISASNDATIKVWSIAAGTCVKTLKGHSAYVYCISTGLDGTIISGGEDRNLVVWSDSRVVQTISHPAQSVWCCIALPNGDIVTGCSDGVLRVFTREEAYLAPADELAAFEEAARRSRMPENIGEMKTEDLPGMEFLERPGNKDGQMVMVRNRDVVECYNWSSSEAQWHKVGDVMGGAPVQKQTYQDESYDYVFDVELDNRWLKLPYNKTEDPWMAAHNFIAKNELSPLLLDQVAKFITSNTSQITLGPEKLPVNQDPYTGVNVAAEMTSYYPESKFVKFETASMDKIRTKMLELNRSHETVLPEALFDDLLMLNQSAFTPSGDQLSLLQELLHWPDADLLPILDIVRLTILQPAINEALFSPESVFRETCDTGKIGPGLFTTLVSMGGITKPINNRIVICRAFANCFAHASSRAVLLSEWRKLIAFVKEALLSDNKNLLVSASTVLLNYSIYAYNEKFAEPEFIAYIFQAAQYGLEETAKRTDASEANFRILVAMGNFVTLEPLLLSNTRENSATLRALARSCEPKVRAVAKALDLQSA